MPSPRKPSKPLKLAKKNLLGSRIVKVKNLTANSGDPKRICTFEMMIESAMGPEWGGANQRLDMVAKVANRIAAGSGK